MSDVRDAEALARWLDGEPGVEPPAGLDPDVVEGISALRPDLAPPFRVTVEQILATITDGPLADPAAVQAAASRLHDWLEANPGQPPPPDIDPAVLETAYALRPDLAPAPRVTIDDVLSELSTGPLAEPTPEAQAPVSLDAARAGRGRWWAWSGVGVAAMAAMAVLFVLPIAHMAGDEKSMSVGAPATDGYSRAAEEAPRMAKKARKKARKKAKRAAKRAPARARAASPTKVAATTYAPAQQDNDQAKVADYRSQLDALERRDEPVVLAAADEQPLEAVFGTRGETRGLPAPAPPPTMSSGMAAPEPPMPLDAAPTTTSTRKTKRADMARSVAAAAAPAAPAPIDADTEESEDEPASGRVVIRMAPESGVTGIELRCSTGYRMRKAVNTGLVTFRNVPDSPCTLYFRGGVPARFGTVHPGQTLTCRVHEGTATCTATDS